MSNFLGSLHIVEDGEEKRPELDLLGVSEHATYIIEVKAHELSHMDRVGIKGTKDKFRFSVAEACCQCERVRNYIGSQEVPEFSCNRKLIRIDQSKPVYKIAVTFQHFSTLLGHMDMLVETRMLEENYRDTWIVSLFDLMVFSDFIESEEDFLEYLDMHKLIYTNHSTYIDEVDLLNGFMNHDLVKKVKPGKPLIIRCGSFEIDEEYAQEYRAPFDHLEDELEMIEEKRT